jgi:hypothetical protein
MPGVRISHPSQKNVTFTLVDGKRPYKQPISCLVCGVVHSFKTYHFRLDDSGSAIVSPEIVERLKRLSGHGFSIGNEVAKPPKQTVGFGGWMERTPIVVHPKLKEPK